MKISEYKQKLRDAFYSRLERKNGWGKEEVKRLFEESNDEVILEMLEEEESK